jgi:hypothetical protein
MSKRASNPKHGRARRYRFGVLAGLSLLGVVTLGGPARAVDPFHAFLLPTLPDTVYAPIGTNVLVPFWVDTSALHFNGYDLLVGCDPAVVTPDSVLEGSLFVNACPNRWLHVTLTDSSFAVSHVLLCAGVAVDGPGTLCQLLLHADTLGVSPLDILSEPDRTFYDEGLYVWPEHPTRPRQVYLHSAVVLVFDPTAGVPAGALPRRTDSLRIYPNPSDGDCRLEFDLPAAGEARLVLAGPDGRLLGSWSCPRLEAGGQSLVWSTRERLGMPLPRGVYYFRLEADSGVFTGGLSILRD